MAHHDPTPARVRATVTGRELQQQYGDRWSIAFEPALRVWSAERRSPDGRHRRFLAEHTPAVLADKLAVAERAQR